MRKIFAVCIFALYTIGSLSAQITVSGILDSTISMNAGVGDAPAFSAGFEEYANLRFQSRLKDKGAVYGAVNLLAAAGDYASNAAFMASYGIGSPLNLSSYTAGENYIAAIELERLYFRLQGEHADFDGGLMRLPFGYGQVWAPSDFLNPRNPLKPDARLRGILSAAFSWYPTDEMKLLAFYSSPRDPFSNEGNGSIAGLSFDKHWNKASIQTLYTFETPDGNSKIESRYGIHRIGLSFKADIEIGLYFDTLYSYNHEAGTQWDGLSFTAGADYSFFDRNLIVLAEYLYNGDTSSTALMYGGNFSNNHYLYTGFTIRFSDFTGMNAALISSIDDVSFSAIVSVNHDLFQGAALSVSAQVPLDRDLFNNDGNHGELGPNYSYFNCTARIRIRF